MATTIPEPTTPTAGVRTTSVLARFTPTPGTTSEQYDESIRRLGATGNWPPPGLALHVAFRVDGDLRVSEVWDSREQLATFGEQLMPLLKDVGIELSGPPELLDVLNVVTR
jgi:hypothetical protein